MAQRKRAPNATAPDGAILVINSGSSSVKFALFSGPEAELRCLWSGAIERIGLPNGRFHIVDAGHATLRDNSQGIPDHQGP